MNKIEYDKVKNLTYREYCEYLKQKYGVSKYDYLKHLVKIIHFIRTNAY